MSIAEWCDVAWEYILEGAPLMASPTEYRDVLWAALHDGKAPEKGAGKGKSASKTEVNEMAALLEKAKALREATPDLDS